MTDAAGLAARAEPRVAGRAILASAAILAVGLVGFAVARAALLPDVGLWDTAEYQAVLPLLGTLHPTGFPAYAILGWLASLVLAPLGSPAFRVDLLSAILLGVAVAGTSWLTLALTGRLSVAALAGLGLAVTPIAWKVGTRADAHALHLAILPFLLLALVAWERRRRAVDAAPAGIETAPERPTDPVERRKHSLHDARADRLLLLAAALFGLGLADHRLIALLAPGIAAFVLVVEPGLVRRRRFVAACLGLAVGIAALLYLELPLRAGPFRAPIVYGQPDTFIGFWYVVLGVQFGGTLLSSLTDPLQELAALGSLTVAQLGILGVALPAALVLACAHRPRYALLTVPAVALTCLFAAGYTDADIGRYYLGPALIAWTWLGIAACRVLDLLAAERGWGVPVGPPTHELPEGSEPASPGEGASDARTLADPVTGSATGGMPTGRAGSRSGDRTSPPPPLPHDRRALGLLASAVMVAIVALALAPLLPARWDALSSDARSSNGRPWLEAALATMRNDSLVVSWWSYSTPLWYAQLIEGRRPDIRVIDDRTILDEGLGDIYSVIDSNLGHRPVYAIRVDQAEISRIMRRYDTAVIPLPGGASLIRIDGIKDASA